MKKFYITLLAILLVLAMVSCGQSKTENNEPSSTELTKIEDNAVTEPPVTKENEVINIGTLMGPTGMGLSKVMEDNETSKLYNFEVFQSPNDIVPKLINGELQIATIPSNLGSVVFNKTEGKIKVVGINTLGVLYILDSSGTVNTLEDLKGKTIVTSGQGAVPEYVLNYILEENGLVVGQDVNVTYLPTHQDVATKIITNEAEIVMLPEPNVSATMMQNENIKNVIDITDEWAKVTNDSMLPMGIVVATTSFLEQNTDGYNIFMTEYRNSVDFVNNNEEAPALIEKFGIVPKAPIAKMAIPNSNIVLIEGIDMEANLKTFYDILFEKDAMSVGGKVPSDEFYKK